MFRKKTFYGADIPPACGYCEHGRRAADPRMILCCKRGVVSPYYHCKRFCYDPLLRVPRRQPKLPSFTAEDFRLD
ncbi:hypothetical protein [Allofournierella sp.]|uniref:hypothetical protein n=1 Tax=Allofournierella sp. TaxID=1940256 RepID=UPI003AB9041D